MNLFAETKPREALYQSRESLSQLAQAEIRRQQQRKQIIHRKEQK